MTVKKSSSPAIASVTGNSGKYLTTNGVSTNWDTIATGSITLISETVASALSSLSFSSIPSTYKELLLVWDGLTANDDNSNFNIRLNNDSSSNYIARMFKFTPNGTLTVATGQAVCGNETSSLSMLFSQTSPSVIRWAGTLRIYNYASTSKLKRYDYLTGGDVPIIGGPRGGTVIGTYNSTSAITSIDVARTNGSGTFSNATNTSIRLYGIS